MIACQGTQSVRRVSPCIGSFLRVPNVSKFEFYMTYLLTAIGQPPGGSSTVHIQTQTIQRTTQIKQYIEKHKNQEVCKPCPVFAGITLAFALQLRKKHRKTSVRVVIHKHTMRIHSHNNKKYINYIINPLNAELNPICHLLALLGVHHFLHISRIRVKSFSLRLLISYIYIYIYMEHPFLMFLDHTQRRTAVGRTPLDE